MSPPADPDIFHITHLHNLQSIVGAGGLWSDAERHRQGFGVQNIGNLRIKGRRLNRPVTVAAFGNLGDYVPFNFCPRSVMLYAVSRGHDDYNGGQTEIVHLRSTANKAIAVGSPWTFTDRHAELFYAEYFEDLAELDKLDWNSIRASYWGGQQNTRECKQAEFLVHHFFRWVAVEEIGVGSTTVAANVASILSSTAHKPTITVRPNWYY